MALSARYFFNWWKIALQYCVGFCCTTCNSVIITYIPLSLPLHPPSPPPFYPSRVSHSARLGSLCYTATSLQTIYFAHGSVYMSMLLSQFVLSSASPHVHKSVPYICISIPALQIGSSITIFINYIYMHYYTIFFLFLTYFTVYNRL